MTHHTGQNANCSNAHLTIVAGQKGTKVRSAAPRRKMSAASLKKPSRESVRRQGTRCSKQTVHLSHISQRHVGSAELQGSNNSTGFEAMLLQILKRNAEHVSTNQVALAASSSSSRMHETRLAPTKAGTSKGNIQSTSQSKTRITQGNQCQHTNKTKKRR